MFLSNFAYKSHLVEFLLLAIFVFPFLGYIASLSFALTLILLFTIPPALCYTHILIKQKYPFTEFLYTWAITSMSYIFVIVEACIVTSRKVTFLEHSLFMVGYVTISWGLKTPEKRDTSTSIGEPASDLLAVKIYEIVNETACTKRNKSEISEEVPQWLDAGYEDSESNMDKEKLLLEKYIISSKNNFVHGTVKQHYDCFRVTSYIGYSNHILFLFVLTVFPLWLAFIANIVLTSICRCYLFNNIIVLPWDCSTVYDSTESAMLFVFALYCCMIALVVLLYNIYKIGACLSFRSKDVDTVNYIKRNSGYIEKCSNTKISSHYTNSDSS